MDDIIIITQANYMANLICFCFADVAETACILLIALAWFGKLWTTTNLNKNYDRTVDKNIKIWKRINKL